MKSLRILLLAVLVLSLGLAGCPSKETPAPTATLVPEATKAPEPTEAPAEAPAAAEIDCMGAASGDKVTMLYQWSGIEEEMLNEILNPLVDACGIVLAPESTRDHALLDTRVAAGTPPDIAFWTQSALDLYQDELVPISEAGGNSDNYAAFWKDLGTRGGKWVGLMVKADIKSIIWYSPVVFEAYGYEVPATWDELDALVEQMVADGNVLVTCQDGDEFEMTPVHHGFGTGLAARRGRLSQLQRDRWQAAGAHVNQDVQLTDIYGASVVAELELPFRSVVIAPSSLPDGSALGALVMNHPEPDAFEAWQIESLELAGRLVARTLHGTSE